MDSKSFSVLQQGGKEISKQWKTSNSFHEVAKTSHENLFLILVATCDGYQDSQSTFVVLLNNRFSTVDFWPEWLHLSKAQNEEKILWLDNTMRWPIKNDLARNWNKPKKDRPDQRTWRDDIKRPTVKNLSVMDPSMNLATLRIVRQKKCKEKIEKKYLLIQIWGVCKKKWFNNKQALKSCLTFCPTIYCVNMTSAQPVLKIFCCFRTLL